ncbi:MAG: Mu-like prophage major head subunit gpT family protein [Acetobacter sp.]|jgi:phage major head subunit gpT-like protein|nr:Mu-like prophage major head subunit gpT family protein [Acetobacter sp.]MCH4060545.1 Mu-like prophage major head subunit gpT family protein [Acetobacter sp.]MCH4087485.1 Mu-like prophage major head subunit gpT family protein [Acetobacter sp.]MCI1294686.1 Mu-like prophage major head subunit gpT family protein [Acetobacter sp.]MCI1321165.1 Mu-like prophage major head subunit gpT family protein [Acetobacter sp.]
MDINAGNIAALTTRINTSFNKYLKVGPSLYQKFSMVMPSSAGENFYPRIAEIGGLREWVGQREIERLKVDGFRIANRTFEQTIGARREDLEDDQFGVLLPAVEQLGYNASVLPDELVFDMLMKGASTKCMDGQNFFDTDHQTYNESGTAVSWSNIGTPQGTEAAVAPWYLFDTTRPLKPMIFQTRRPFNITPKTQLTSDNVFHDNEFLWGVDGRCAAGVGMYQLAYRSTRPLNGTSFQAALTAFAAQRRKDGAPYGIRPNLLVVPTNLESAGRLLVNAEFVPSDAGTATISNPWKGAVDLMVAPRLSLTAGG